MIYYILGNMDIYALSGEWGFVFPVSHLLTIMLIFSVGLSVANLSTIFYRLPRLSNLPPSYRNNMYH